MSKSILIVSNDRRAAETLRSALTPECRVSVSEALHREEPAFPRHHPVDVLFIDIDLLGDGLSHASTVKDARRLLQEWRDLFPGANIVVLSAQERLRDAVNAIRAGAASYLATPILPEEIAHVMNSLREAEQLQMELDYLRDQFWKVDALDLVRTDSPRMKEVFHKVRTVAAKKVTVLLTGETGTGKGVIARLIHQHSKRANDPFIGVHCGAIPDTLLESELFGHEKGSFTGAAKRTKGKFEIAHGGSIFLDEIGTVTPSMQIKLLQVLQDGSLQRIGSEVNLDVDVRILAATNEDLNRRRLDGTFRSDLYYRLNVFPIDLPPLRDRLEDLPQLAEIFLSRLNRLYGKDIHAIHQEVLSAFTRYDWPGNIRELENLIERAYLLEESDVLSPDAFPHDLMGKPLSVQSLSLDTSLRLADFREQSYLRLERQYLDELLRRQAGRIGKSAEQAGITTRQLNRLMQKHGLRKGGYKTTVS